MAVYVFVSCILNLWHEVCTMNINKCISEVVEGIHRESGKNYNIFLSLNVDKLEFLDRLARSLSNLKDHICIVTEDAELQEKIHHNICNIDELLDKREYKNRPSYWRSDAIILVDERASARARLLKEFGKRHDAVIVSIGTPAIGHKEREELGNLGISVESVNVKERVRETNGSVAKALLYSRKDYLLFTLKSILDIRDLKLADYEEQDMLTAQLLGNVSEYSDELKTLYKKIADHKLSLTELNYSQIDCIGLVELIRFLQDIIASVGIDNNMVIDEFISIQRIKAEKEFELNHQNPEISEKARIDVEKYITDRVTKITKNTLTIAAKENIEAELMEELGLVWDKLNKSTKNFLVTGVANYHMLCNYHKRNPDLEVDFSGVCLLFCKALELELWGRIISKYKSFLNDPRFRSGNGWPNPMLVKRGSGPSKPITKDDYTLGSTKYILGYYKDFNVNESVHSCFLDFVGMTGKLYRTMNLGEIEAHLLLIAKHTDTITDTYRNKAAHKTAIDYTTATSCKEFMLEVEHAFKLIFEKLK